MLNCALIEVVRIPTGKIGDDQQIVDHMFNDLGGDDRGCRNVVSSHSFISVSKWFHGRANDVLQDLV
jgi:hypothetical protein